MRKITTALALFGTALLALFLSTNGVTGAAGGIHHGDSATGGTVNQSLSVADGDISLVATGNTCRNADVASGTVGRGCIWWDTTSCGAGKYQVDSYSLWNPTQAQGGASGTNTISGIFYSTAIVGQYYSVPNGGTDGNTPMTVICHNNSTTAKWEVAGYGGTWCIYLVPNSGSVSPGGC